MTSVDAECLTESGEYVALQIAPTQPHLSVRTSCSLYLSALRHTDFYLVAKKANSVIYTFWFATQAMMLFNFKNFQGSVVG